MRSYLSNVAAWCVGATILLSASTAKAGLLPVGLAPVAQLDGSFRWTYSITLPSSTQIKTGDFFTIYDFAGYVPASNGQPSSDWAFSAQNVGITPGGVAPNDNPTITNLTWRYIGMDSTIGQVGLGNFWASSIYSESTSSHFTSRTHKYLPGDTRGQSNITSTMVPVPTATPEVPEPATLALAGLGLPFVGLYRAIRRRRFSK